MTEVERLKERLYGSGMSVKNFKVWPGPSATAESVAREVNYVLDEMEAGTLQVIEDLD